MNKIWFYVFLVLVLCIQLLYSQKKETVQAAEKDAFLAKAPAHVQQYYRVFDSLANTSQNEPAYKKWTLGELKKYASMVYDANEYDPVQTQLNFINNHERARLMKVKYASSDFDVVAEVKNRVSKKHAALIRDPYWLMITVEDVIMLPYIVNDNPAANITEIRVRGRVTKVWKGKKYNIGDEITCYYLDFWNYKGLTKGTSYIVAPYPLMKGEVPNEIIYALGSPNRVQQSVFPIENGFINDEDNFFGLGVKVEVGKFTESLSSMINQIKSWNGGVQ